MTPSASERLHVDILKILWTYFDRALSYKFLDLASSYYDW